MYWMSLTLGKMQTHFRISLLKRCEAFSNCHIAGMETNTKQYNIAADLGKWLARRGRGGLPRVPPPLPRSLHPRPHPAHPLALALSQ